MKNVINRVLVTKKRIVSIVLALLVSIGTGIAANGWEWFGSNGQWKLEGNTLYLYGFGGNMQDFSMALYNPQLPPWYDSRETIEEVSFDGRFSSIGNYAFLDCVNLKTLNFPNGLQTIGIQAFANCSSLTSISLPEGVETIRVEAFKDCTGLTSFVVPNSVKTIGSAVFSDCTNLRKVTIGEGVETFEMSSIMPFYGCTGLDTVVWNVKACNTPFGFVSERNPFHEESNNDGHYAFDIRAQIKSFTFGDKVEFIPGYLCAGMTNITSIEIPASVGTLEPYGGLQAQPAIRDGAFAGCTGLKTVIVQQRALVYPTDPSYGDLVPSHPLSTYFGGQVEHYIIGDAIDSIGSTIFWNAPELRTVTLGTNLVGVKDDLFSNCPNLHNVVWRCANYTGEYSPFENVRSQITSFVFAEGVEHIPDRLCQFMSLSSINLPNSVKTIGARAFMECLDIASVNIPSSLTRVGESAFQGTALESVYLSDIAAWCAVEGSEYLFGPSLYLNGELITDLVIPTGVTRINAGAFAARSAIKSVTIPNSVTAIDEHAFSSSVETVAFDASALTGDDYSSYAGRMGRIFGTQVKKYILGEHINRIGNNAFAKCSGLQEITMPAGITGIGEEAFRECSGLTEIAIPDDVTSIGDRAFYNCSALNKVTFGTNLQECGSYAFGGCNNLKTVVWNTKNCDFTSEETPFYVYNNGPSNNFDIRGQITSFTFGEQVAHIPAYLCSNMTQLTTIELPSSTQSVGEEAFNKCKNVTSLKLNHGLISIANGAFGYCSGLTSIDIPATVTALGQFTFGECNNVRSVINRATTPQPLEVSNWCFSNMDVYSVPLYVPKASISLYKTATCWKDFHNILELNTQGIEDVVAGFKGDKILHEGHIYILRGENIYTLQGQEVR